MKKQALFGTSEHLWIRRSETKGGVPVENSKINKNRLANFYLELLELEDKVSSVGWKEIVTGKIKENWLLGVPVLSQLQPEIDVKLFSDVFMGVVRACLKWQPGPQPLSEEVISRINGLSKGDVSNLIGVIIKDVEGEKLKWVEKLNISRDMMDFLADNTARILLSGFAACIMPQLDIERWDKGYCPVCGDSPVMAKLTGDAGIRKLYCGRCESEWRFNRLGCPFCGSKDSSQISFIMPEDKKQYRLYLCDQCKSYIKTVDERQCGEVDLFCEDLATADFDRLANSEGYRCGNKRYRA
ncbi:FdhE protein [Desulfohalotomaculum tongense]|nr:FdhE protein [Desulforadius tongensis]